MTDGEPFDRWQFTLIGDGPLWQTDSPFKAEEGPLVDEKSL